MPLSPSIYATNLDNVATTLGAAYTAGAGQLALATGTGAMFGTPSTSAPVRVTVVNPAAVNASGQILVSARGQVASYLCTGISGDTLSGVTLEGGTDQNFPLGSTVAAYVTAHELNHYQTDLNALQSAVATLQAPATLGVPGGGTGLSTVAAGSLLAGAGTSPLAPVTIGSGLTLASGVLAASGTVTTISATGITGLTASVANPTTTPAIALSTSLDGVVFANGSGFETATIGSGLALSGTTLTASGAAIGAAVGGSPIDLGVLFVSSTGTLADNSGFTFNPASGVLAIPGTSFWTNVGEAIWNVGGAIPTATTGSGMVAVGSSALAAVTSGNNHVAIGTGALSTATTSQFCVGIGPGAMQNTTASNNLGIGYKAGFALTSGGNNTAIGTQALVNGTTGTGNVAIGYESFMSLATGSSNVAIGSGTGAASSGGVGNTFLGYGAGSTTDVSNCVAIGHNAVASASTTILLGGAFGEHVVLGGPTAAIGSAQLTVECATATNPGVLAQAAASQTASLFVGQTSTGTAVFTVAASGTITTANHLDTSGATPTVAAGAGAGTSPTVSVVGSDVAGRITIATGTSPTASSALATLTFALAHANVPKAVVIAPANAAAAALAGAAKIWADAGGVSTTAFTLNVGTAALAASTTYIFSYIVIG